MTPFFLCHLLFLCVLFIRVSEHLLSALLCRFGFSYTFSVLVALQVLTGLFLSLLRVLGFAMQPRGFNLARCLLIHPLKYLRHLALRHVEHLLIVRSSSSVSCPFLLLWISIFSASTPIPRDAINLHANAQPTAVFSYAMTVMDKILRLGRRTEMEGILIRSRHVDLQ